jgi:hypothetical protein
VFKATTGLPGVPGAGVGANPLAAPNPGPMPGMPPSARYGRKR